MARKRPYIPSPSSHPQNDVADEHDQDSLEIPVQPSHHTSGSDSESDKSPPPPVKSKRKKPIRKREAAKSPVEIQRVSDGDQKGGKKPRVRVSIGDESKSPSNRVFSEEDELVILNGMIDYRLAKDEDPHSDYKAFFKFVEDSLHVQVSVRQMRDKIRKLKKKYLNNAGRGDAVVFAKPNEDKLFQLSKKIWGGGNEDEVEGGTNEEDTGTRKAVLNDGVNDKDDVVVEDEIQNGVVGAQGLDFKAMYPFLSEAWEADVPQSLKDIGLGVLSSIAGENIRGLEKEMKGVYVKEMELHVQKLDLKAKLVKVVLDGIRSSDP